MREGVLALSGRRDVAYAEMGPRDAPVVFYFHGTPGSRKELGFAERIARSHDLPVRVIGLNRPGFGPSTFVRGFGFLDWPPIVAEVADRLRIGTFGVLGASGGCPFALACGLLLGERVPSIGIVVGLAPIDAPGMGTAPGVTLIPASQLRRRVDYAAIGVTTRLLPTRLLASLLPRALADTDRVLLDDPEAARWFVEDAREGFAHLGRAASHEAALGLAPWGFDPEDVHTPTHLWYGGADRRIPVSAGEWLARRLPNSSLTVWPRHGHFSWARSQEAVKAILAIAEETASGGRTSA